MTVELSVPDRVRAGEPVPITVRATNRGTAPATLYLRGRPIAFDVIVTDARGKIVWRRLEGATITMILQVRELKPGESLTLEDVWPQHNNAGAAVEPGEYHLKAQLLTDTEPLESASVSLRIGR
jgi:Intracellular proteinase inhibitor